MYDIYDDDPIYEEDAVYENEVYERDCSCDYEDDDLELGFDPYEGCYTWDC